MPSRMTWTDASGGTRSASIRTENVSALGALVECLSSTEIPVHRLVSLSLSTRAHDQKELPSALRHPNIQAAVSRVATPTDPYQPSRLYGLRLLVSEE